MDIRFTCKYCLETHVVEGTNGEFESLNYPKVCPHCKTTMCDSCGEILKAENNYCYHCGEVDPNFLSNHVRTASTSASYAVHNWVSKVKRWNDGFGQLEDENHRYEIWTDMEGNRTLREVTIENGERKTLSERTLSDKEIEAVQNESTNESN